MSKKITQESALGYWLVLLLHLNHKCKQGLNKYKTFEMTWSWEELRISGEKLSSDISSLFPFILVYLLILILA